MSEHWINKMNQLGGVGIPFLFILDFELVKCKVIPLDKLSSDVLYKTPLGKNYRLPPKVNNALQFERFPMDYEVFEDRFKQVLNQINKGNSYLLNLTFPTPIVTNYTLRELFFLATAKYKLYFEDQFIVFSPETFVRISDQMIYTYPMKGTIDASILDAKATILNDLKETSEHYTIVDLLRNDLSKIAKEVKVTKFRYIDKIKTNTKTLLQVSSEIEGKLADDYQQKLGDIFAALLPAGSISGAPKRKTVDIIQDAEPDQRGYYTGIFGVYDGVNLDAGVMIRYIERHGDNLVYRSGCGITSLSKPQEEFSEMIDKVYVPIGRKH